MVRKSENQIYLNVKTLSNFPKFILDFPTRGKFSLITFFTPVFKSTYNHGNLESGSYKSYTYNEKSFFRVTLRRSKNERFLPFLWITFPSNVKYVKFRVPIAIFNESDFPLFLSVTI